MTFTRAIAPIAFFSAAGVLLFRTVAQTMPPGEALVRGAERFRANDLQEAGSLFEIAAREKAFRPWVSVYLGRIAEERGELEEAKRYFESVSDSSGAVLEARVALTELARRDLPGLEPLLQRSNRPDLVAENLFRRARRLRSSGQTSDAMEAFSEVRRRSPRSAFARQARQALAQIEKGERSAASLLDEAKLLLAEGEPHGALATTQQAREGLPESSPAQFEALLVEVDVLRQMNRSEQAEQLLTRIGGRGSTGTADVALAKLARSAWNRNDHRRALDLLDSLVSRFPNSSLRTEAEYMRGRIFEESGSTAEATVAYRNLLTTTSEVRYQLQSIRRLAWLAMLQRDYRLSAQYFERMRQLARRALTAARAAVQSTTSAEAPPPDPSRKTFFTYVDDYRHAAYWEAVALSLLDRPGSHAEVEPRDLFAELAATDPRGYYGHLARSALSSPPPISAGPLDLCRLADEEGWREQFAPFRGTGAFAAHEIDWAFVGGVFAGAESIERPTALQRAVTKGSLLVDCGVPRPAVELAEERLSDFTILGEIPETLRACHAALLTIAFPLPLREEFERASKEQGIALPLLFALSRTESYFDSAAVSPSGALGLVQLMPQTAAQEGAAPAADLFDPRLNLELGAKHLRRLFGDFGDTKVFAIAAYNAGSKPVTRWRDRYPDQTPEQWTELVGFPETQTYIKRVLLAEAHYSRILGSVDRSSPKAGSRLRSAQ